MTGPQLFEALNQGDSVKRVEWQKANAQQGNVSGRHDTEHNVLVLSSLGGSRFANKPMEFELSRDQRSKHLKVPFTVTALFKDLPPFLAQS